MEMEITVPEVMEIINGIREEPQGLFAMIRDNVQETVGQYLSMLMDKELGHFLGRDRYVRCKGDANHRNGSYPRKFTLKGLGEVDLKVPRPERFIRHPGHSTKQTIRGCPERRPQCHVFGRCEHTHTLNDVPVLLDATSLPGK